MPRRGVSASVPVLFRCVPKRATELGIGARASAISGSVPTMAADIDEREDQSRARPRPSPGHRLSVPAAARRSPPRLVEDRPQASDQSEAALCRPFCSFRASTNAGKLRWIEARWPACSSCAAPRCRRRLSPVGFLGLLDLVPLQLHRLGGVGVGAGENMRMAADHLPA